MPVNFSAAAKAPPRKTAKTVAPATYEAPRTVRELREEGLNGIGQLGQGACAAFNQFADAATIGMHFPGMARELATLADHYEVLAKPIDLIIQIGPFGALLNVLAPFVMQMLANHGIIHTTGVLGVVPPETLDAQMRTQIMQMHAQALKAQALAQKEMEEAQAEIQALMDSK